jgi:MipA family protein
VLASLTTWSHLHARSPCVFHEFRIAGERPPAPSIFATTPQDGAFDASAKYLQSAHSGYGATLALAAKYKLVLDPRDNVAFEADSTFANQKSMQTFFGVTPAQSAHSAAGLPAFSPSAGFKRVSTSATWVHILTPAWSVNGSVGVGRLLGDASASPVTEHSTWIFGGVGVAYSF